MVICSNLLKGRSTSNLHAIALGLAQSNTIAKKRNFTKTTRQAFGRNVVYVSDTRYSIISQQMRPHFLLFCRDYLRISIFLNKTKRDASFLGSEVKMNILHWSERKVFFWKFSWTGSVIISFLHGFPFKGQLSPARPYLLMGQAKAGLTGLFQRPSSAESHD